MREFTEGEKKLIARRLVDEDTGCWLWTGARQANGYGVVGLAGRTFRVHRLAALLWLGLVDGTDAVVRHTCNNKNCFNPEHLLLGTQKENILDAAKLGRMGGAKLNENQVRIIRERHANGETMSELAFQYEVAVTTISNVIHGTYYKHVN